MNHLPVGVFDSGVGGLTVYRALHEHLPNERFVYLGDTARVPYGTKSLATVERYAVENAQFLAARGIKLLVVACNTASALALPAIRNALNIDVVGVIGPGARAAVGIDADNAGSPRSQALRVVVSVTIHRHGINCEQRRLYESDQESRSKRNHIRARLSVVRAFGGRRLGG